MSVVLLIAVPARWRRLTVSILTGRVCVSLVLLRCPWNSFATPYGALCPHRRTLFPWPLASRHSLHRSFRVYVSYWYYKRPDIPSGVRKRPPGRDKTGAELFFSTHLDENKVQTLMGHCKVYGRPVWLERGASSAPLHTYFCSKVYDLQGQYVGGTGGVRGGEGSCSAAAFVIPATCLWPPSVSCC